jgi:hypothetical protein
VNDDGGFSDASVVNENGVERSVALQQPSFQFFADGPKR